MIITHIQKCVCGAITIVYDNGVSNSMYQETFDRLKLDIPQVHVIPDSSCCNHCINHWGIDLCECGSGEKVGECECGSNKAHDELGVKFDSFGAIVRNFS
jgi:hypothetical protein